MALYIFGSPEARKPFFCFSIMMHYIPLHIKTDSKYYTIFSKNVFGYQGEYATGRAL